MALSAYAGSFLLANGSVANVVVNGLGFQPKALICWYTGRGDAASAVGRANHFTGFGVAVSAASRRAMCENSTDTANPSANTSRWIANGVVLSCDFVPATDGIADLASFDADGFTISIPDAFPRDTRVAFLALGGADITNAEVLEMTDPGVNGNSAKVLTGAFRPDLVILFGPSNVSAPPAGTVSAGRIWISAFTSVSDAHVILVGADGASTPQDTESYHRVGESTSGVPATVGGAVNSRSTVASIDSNGFTLNWVETSGSNLVIFGLAIKGGSYAVGDFQTLASTGPIVKNGLTVKPKAVMVLSHCKAQSASDTGQLDSLISIGAAHGPANRITMAHVDREGPAAAEVATAINYEHIYVHIDETDAAAATIVGSADLTSLDPTGFTLNQDDADPTQALATFIAFGDPAVTGKLTRVAAVSAILDEQ